MVNATGQTESKNRTVMMDAQSQVQKRQWEKTFWEEQRAFESQFCSPVSAQLESASLSNSIESRDVSQAVTISAEDGKKSFQVVTNEGLAIQNLTADSLVVRNRQSKPEFQVTPTSAFQVTQSTLTEPKVNRALAQQSGIYAPAYTVTTQLKQSMIHVDGKEASIWLGRWAKSRELEVFTELKSILNLFGLSLKKLVIRGCEYTPFMQHSQSKGGR